MHSYVYILVTVLDDVYCMNALNAIYPYRCEGL
jgi:hypothetical protein